MDNNEICLCGHAYDEHLGGRFRCQGLDSYRTRCTCPAPVEDDSCPDDEDQTTYE